MTTTPPVSPGNEGPVARGKSGRDAGWTALVHVMLLVFLGVMILVGGAIVSIMSAGCSVPGCEGRFALAQTVLVLTLLGVFVLSVVVSIIRLVQGRSAVYVPVVAGMVMLVCVAVASAIAWFAANIPQ